MNWQRKSDVKRSKVKVTKNENAEIVFCAYVHEKWIDLFHPILHIICKIQNTFHHLAVHLLVVIAARYNIVIMRPSLGDRIERCASSVRPSIRHVPPIFSKQESREE